MQGVTSELATLVLETPLGRIGVAAQTEGLTRVELKSRLGARRSRTPAGRAAVRHVEAAARALRDYFAGRREDFEALTLAPTVGTPFQQLVWRALRKIPYGETWGYGELAQHIGHPGAARAVGGANHCNPLAIIVPCHRVIGADGRLVGYGGGLARKRWLLDHEQAALLPGLEQRQGALA